ncbi:MAG TPA: tetratricopeptide repeat protein [Polyangia bacterium]
MLSLLSLPAAADDIDDLAARAVTLESKIRELDEGLRPPAGPGADYAERRALDGEVLYRLKQYEEAAIVLLDVVEKYAQSPAYPAALFFLADSLYQKHDFLSAKRYFAKVVARGQSDRNFQLALQRLVELSLRTGDLAAVEEHLRTLEQLPPSQLLPSVPYVRGKFEFFRGRHEEAQRIFDTIPATSEYYFQAQYFIATGLVMRKQYDMAMSRFMQILRLKPRKEHAGDQQILELSYLALGRLYFELGKIDRAIDQYQNIGRQSDVFPEALYETGWSFIKTGDHRKALRSLDLLMLARPDASNGAEVRLLMANLHLRVGESGDALQIFDKTRVTFEPVQQKLDQLMAKRPDAQAFFRSLMRGQAEKFEIQVALPEQVQKWVRAHGLVEHATRVAGDINALRESLTEAEQLVTRVERAIMSPARVNIFPEMARARERALEVENQVTDIRGRLAARQRELTQGAWSETERQQADRLHDRRQTLTKAVANIPRSSDGYEQRANKARKVYEGLEQRAKELWIQIESLSAQLVAIERYFADTRGKQKIPAAIFESQINEMRQIIEDLRKEHDRVRNDIISARENVGVDDALALEEAKLRDELKQVVAQERELAGRVLARLQGPARAKVEQLQSVLARLETVEGRLQAFNGRIDQAVEQRLQDAKTVLAEEKIKVAGYRQQITAYEKEADDLGGGASLQALKDVRQRAYKLVVESDVGVTDVAWARKDEKSQSVSRLQREQERERRLLEEEFQQVRQQK